MKRKKINFSAKEIDSFTKESMHSIKGGKNSQMSLQDDSSASDKEKPGINVTIEVSF